VGALEGAARGTESLGEANVTKGTLQKWVLLVAGGIAVLAGPILAHDGDEDWESYPSEYTVRTDATTMHTGSHYIDTCSGDETVSGVVTWWPSWRDGGYNTYDVPSVTDRLKVVKAVPLGGTLVATSSQISGHPSYGCLAYKESKWEAGPIIGSEGTVVVSMGDASAEPHKVTAHAVTRYRMILATTSFPSHNWSGDVAMVSNIKEGGAVPSDEFDMPVVDYDENGQLILDTPQTTALRLTSSFEHLYGGTIRYRYTLENFSDTGRDFEFTDIRTSEFPGGWSGTVPAEDSVEITNTVSDQNIWVQCTQANTCIHDDPSEENCEPIDVYVPQNRTAFTGVTTIQSTTLIPTSSSREVVFRVSASAQEAYLIRTYLGQATIVDSDVGAFAANTDYTLTDPSVPVGACEYVVLAGIRTNGSPSEAEEIE
jgi:hypothetical protein